VYPFVIAVLAVVASPTKAALPSASTIFQIWPFATPAFVSKPKKVVSVPCWSTSR
jgi:hypothetical protein